MEPLNLRRYQDYSGSYVISCFEKFYAELVRQKEKVITGAYVPFSSSTDMIPGDLNADSAEGARVIQDTLKAVLEKDLLQVNQQSGEFASQYFKEAIYIMVSLADEIFLSLSWQGRSYWEDNLFESYFFGTHDAGDQFFDRLDTFLANRDPAKKDLGQLYLLALGLGFLGKFRDVNDQGQLRRYLKNLYIFIHHRDLKLFEEPERLFTESYMHTLEGGDPDMHLRKNPAQKWGFKIAAGVLGFLVISHVAWRMSVHDLVDITSHIRHEALL